MTPNAPETPAQIVESVTEEAILELVREKGRRPYRSEVETIRKSVAQKALDRASEWGASGNREEVERVAAIALGGPFDER
jgi:hypothetical protein